MIKLQILIGRMEETARLKKFVIGYLSGLIVSYLLVSVIRLVIGTPPSKAWLPSPALVGLWAGFALWIVTAAVISRRSSRRQGPTSR